MLVDFVLFLIFGILILLVGQFVDAFYFIVNIYRDDIKEYNQEEKREHTITEEQFETLEDFCNDEAMKTKQASGSFSADNADLISVKELVLGFRERLAITE